MLFIIRLCLCCRMWPVPVPGQPQPPSRPSSRPRLHRTSLVSTVVLPPVQFKFVDMGGRRIAGAVSTIIGTVTVITRRAVVIDGVRGTVVNAMVESGRESLVTTAVTSLPVRRPAGLPIRGFFFRHRQYFS